MNSIHKMTWSELEKLIRESNLSDEEECIVKMLGKGLTITQISMQTSLSESTVSRRIKVVKDKMARETNPIPVWEKLTLTLEEASDYSNIGIQKIREMVSDPRCTYVIQVGVGKRLIKRKEFEEFILSTNNI